MIDELKKIKIRIYIIFSMLTVILGFVLVPTYGKKDAISMCLAFLFLILEIYLLFKNKKYSVLLYIVSIPILVTARKLCYFNFFIFRITFETIYISFLFILSYKEVIKLIKKRYGNKNLDIFMDLLFVLIVFSYNSCFFSTDVFYSLGEVFIAILVPVMFMLSVMALFKKEDIKKILYHLFIAMNISCIYGFMQIISLKIPLSKIIKNREYITFGYNNINIFAGIMILIIPVILYIIVANNNSKKEKIFLYITFGLNTVSLIITYSRGAWICLIISVIIIMFNKKKRKTNIVIGLLMLIALKPALSYILTRGSYASLWKNASTVARIHGAFTDFLIMFKYPFGAGPGTYPYLYKTFAIDGYKLIPEFIRLKISVASYALESAHNLFFTIGAEFGVVCLIVFLVIIINRLTALFKNYKDNRGIFSAMVSYLIISLLTGTELNHKGIITGPLILFLYFAIIELNRRETND